MFENVEDYPVDPIMIGAEYFANDPRDGKLDLTVGIYQDEDRPGLEQFMGMRDQIKDRISRYLAILLFPLALFAGGTAFAEQSVSAEPMETDASGFVIVGPRDIPGLAAATLSALERQRVYKVLFRHHPDARAELLAELEELADDPDGGLYFDMAWEAARAQVESHVSRQIDLASDEVIQAYLGLSFAMVDDLRGISEVCVGSFTGEMGLADFENALTKPIDWALLYADILESAAKNPSPPPDPREDGGFEQLIADAYTASGRDAGNLELLADVLKGRETSPEACQAISTYLQVLLSMEERDAALVFKSMRGQARSPAK